MFGPPMHIPCANCGERVHQAEIAAGKHQCVPEKVEEHQVHCAQAEMDDQALAMTVGKWGLEPSIGRRRKFADYLRDHEEEA